jgi:4-hydroxy-tetrahydrodipicolinate synthase
MDSPEAAYKDLAAHDVDRIFAAGTTGEFTSLIEEERLDVCETPAQARAATRPSGT